MPDISIRQLAEKLKVSHTAIRNAIADIKAESGVEIGTSQGQGKATLLSESEQALIAQRFYKPADEQPAPTSSAAVLTPGMTYGIPGMTRYTPPAMQLDTDEIDVAKQSYQQTGQQAVLDTTGLMQAYATFRAVQTIKEIDAVFEGVKASAMNSAAHSLGKLDTANG